MVVVGALPFRRLDPAAAPRPPFIPAILLEVTGLSGPESGTVGAVRSGASRSSSPAIPTSVKSA